MARPKLVIPEGIWSEMVREYQAGSGPGTIAKKWGYNANTVSTKLRRAGITRGSADAPTPTLLYKSKEDGYSNPSVVVDVSSEAGEASRAEIVQEKGEHVLVKDVTRVLNSHRKRSKRLGSLLDEAVREARNGCLAKDLQILTIAHERLVKLDRLCLGIEGGPGQEGADSAKTLINHGVIVIPGKVGESVQDWAETVAECIPPDSPAEGDVDPAPPSEEVG